MCLLAVNHSGLLDAKVFDNAWDNNSDGFGMAWVENRTVHRFKTLASAAIAYNHYNKIRSKHGNTGPIILHFRLATHGKTDYANCHPFKVRSGLVFAHNGILEVSHPNKSLSDTAAFCELLKQLPDNFLRERGVRVLIEMATAGNKLAFLDRDGNVDIFGRDRGHEVGGTWFSNDTYEKARRFDFSWYEAPGTPIGRYTKGVITRAGHYESLYTTTCTICDTGIMRSEAIIAETGELLCKGCSWIMDRSWPEKSMSKLAAVAGDKGSMILLDREG